ncbi:ABC transporter permease subunit [Haloplanus rubicundus]|uniref:ABC transporter permease subunit n=1 Tax=Haloplanus rubicundus TaxID=1547898 RepID=A0A345E1Y9_9EURY|nr:ABC transporter permease [Haloplanus rubicundus]AXG06211.1 ABC transporter permease subunit [Haloplanus rubicundus]AXG09590.1 ABC transporter permease subunit [Haloplanus rubicundus]
MHDGTSPTKSDDGRSAHGPAGGTSLVERVASTPTPAALWAVGLLLLVGVEFGAVLQAGTALLAGLGRALSVLSPETVEGLRTAAESVPTLLSRETVPNQGWRRGPDGPWRATFAGLEPKVAWLVRVALVYAYAFAFLAWLWLGYRRYRTHYRLADWTPRDDVIDRLRGHRWGQFGFVVVFVFVVMALFAPALGPTTVDRNVLNPYDHEIRYYDAGTGEVDTITVGNANLQSGSEGAGQNVGPWTYDAYGRFHPFGTLPSGKDLFTFLAEGARISLSIGVASMLVSGVFGLAMATLTAYYKGLTDLLVVLTSDSIKSLPLLMVLILVVVVFQGTWLAEFYDGAVLLTAVLALVNWPYLWRAVRGPALQVAEATWIDAARSFGQSPAVIMRKHMAPYVVGYMMVYTSMSLGGVIIAVAGLSFLGLGITPPTPEWGRAVSVGQPYVATASWHISLLPGILITLVVTGFNALGDGIRDAIDPESEGGSGVEGAAAGGGGA